MTTIAELKADVDAELAVIARKKCDGWINEASRREQVNLLDVWITTINRANARAAATTFGHRP